MKCIFDNILILIKCSTFVLVFMCMLLQTSLLTISIFTENNTELIAEMDWDEDSDEEDSKEKNNRDEKIEHPITSILNLELVHAPKISFYLIQKPVLDFCPEIPIPPPDYS